MARSLRLPLPRVGARDELLRGRELLQDDGLGGGLRQHDQEGNEKVSGK